MEVPKAKRCRYCMGRPAIKNRAVTGREVLSYREASLRA